MGKKTQEQKGDLRRSVRIGQGKAGKADAPSETETQASSTPAKRSRKEKVVKETPEQKVEETAPEKDDAVAENGETKADEPAAAPEANEAEEGDKEDQAEEQDNETEK